MFSTGSRIDKSSGPIRAACSEKWSMEDKDLRTAHAANNDTHMIHAKHTIRSAVPNPYSNVSPGPVSTATIKRKFSGARSEEHTSELQSPMSNSYAVFCLKTKKKNT